MSVDHDKTLLSCYDLAREFAGAVKGMPRDPATNPKYLERFAQ